MAKRAYCKNTVKGTRRGRKYPPKVRAEVLMAMLSSGSICAVARRYGVPESTIRSWMAEEAGRSDAFAKERQAAAREIAIRASLGARAQVSYLQSRVDESQRAAQVRAKLHRKLDEDTRARCFAVGTLLKSDAEELADATETGLVLYAAEDSYDRQLGDEERKLLDAQLERYGERVMSDKNAAAMAAAFVKRGYKIVSGGTDNHLMLVDLRTKFPELTGKLAEKCLVAADITTNKNMVPFDSRSPFQTSGLRFGTPAITTRGLKEDRMDYIVGLIDRVLHDPENEANIAAVRKDVNALMAGYPLFAW